MSELLLNLKMLSERGEVRALDYQFGRFLHDCGASEVAVLAGTLVSAELAEGHVCLMLERLSEVVREKSRELKWLVRQYPLSSLTPEAGIVGDGSDLTPLVLDNGKLYLYRYWQYEVAVADQLRTSSCEHRVDLDALKAGLDQLFPVTSDEPDWQKVAAAIAAQRRFSVISGGPGTGKTTTVTKLLALIAGEGVRAGKAPVIKLAAPTGKAAARLSESISGALATLQLPPELSALIPNEASTLHRLLGVIPNSHHFRHNHKNPLHLDLLVVDEASMIDLPMMTRLLDALPRSARLILIGDRDQLASVEAGSVLGDICRWPGEAGYSAEQSARLAELCQLDIGLLQRDYPSPLADSVALLRKSYRFHDQSGIGHLARASNNGDVTGFGEVLRQGYGDIELQPLTSPSYDTLIQRAAGCYSTYLKLLSEGATPEQVLESFAEAQLLCALREGPYGVGGLNDAIRDLLARQGWVRGEGHWYSGRPIIITRNDAMLELYNGDIGIAMPDTEGNLKVWFEQSGRLRSVLPSRLPEHETVFAMTVHKSQGSEFSQVLMLLPPEETPVVTRELLYTGITRAKKTLALYATERVLNQAIQRPTERNGGLAERLWEAV